MKYIVMSLALDTNYFPFLIYLIHNFPSFELLTRTLAFEGTRRSAADADDFREELRNLDDRDGRSGRRTESLRAKRTNLC